MRDNQHPYITGVAVVSVFFVPLNSLFIVTFLSAIDCFVHNASCTLRLVVEQQVTAASLTDIQPASRASCSLNNEVPQTRLGKENPRVTAAA